MQSGTDNIEPQPKPTPSSESTPSPLVTALQREHPEWVSEVIYAFGETTIVVPREHIVDACSFSKRFPKDLSIFFLTSAAPIAEWKKSLASKSTITSFQQPNITAFV